MSTDGKERARRLLARAAREGSARAAQEALKRLGRLDDAKERSWLWGAMLGRASGEDDAKLARLMVQAGACADDEASLGEGRLLALVSACATFREQVALALLGAPLADPSRAPEVAATALAWSVTMGSVAILKAALDLGADPNARQGGHSGPGDFFVESACSPPRPRMVKALLDAGARPTLKALASCIGRMGREAEEAGAMLFEAGGATLAAQTSEPCFEQLAQAQGHGRLAGMLRAAREKSQLAEMESLAPALGRPRL